MEEFTLKFLRSENLTKIEIKNALCGRMHSRIRSSPSIYMRGRENIFIYLSIRGIIQKIAVIHKSRYQDRVCVIFTFVKSWLISM